MNEGDLLPISNEIPVEYAANLSVSPLAGKPGCRRLHSTRVKNHAHYSPHLRCRCGSCRAMLNTSARRAAQR